MRHLALALATGLLLAATPGHAVPAPASPAARSQVRIQEGIEAWIRRQGHALVRRSPRLGAQVAVGAAFMYTANLGILTLEAPDLPLEERARLAGQVLLSPEVLGQIGAIVGVDHASRAALRAAGVSVTRVVAMCVTPALGDFVATVALDVMASLDLRGRLHERAHAELERYTGGSERNRAALRALYDAHLGPRTGEDILRTLTGGSVDYLEAGVGAGGFAVGALAGSALGGLVGGIPGGLVGGFAGGFGGSMVSRSLYEEVADYFIDKPSILVHSLRLTNGSFLDRAPPDLADLFDPDPGTRGRAATRLGDWVRARRQARQNLLDWAAEGLIRANTAYNVLMAGPRDARAAATLGLSLRLVAAWVEAPEGPPPGGHPELRRLALGLYQARCGARQALRSIATERKLVPLQSLWEAGLSRNVKLPIVMAVASAHRADAFVTRELQAILDGLLDGLAGARVPPTAPPPGLEVPEVAGEARDQVGAEDPPPVGGAFGTSS